MHMVVLTLRCASDQFIMEDSAVGPYVVAPERGKGVNDITSCCAAFNQKLWQLSDRDSVRHIFKFPPSSSLLPRINFYFWIC